MRIVFMGSGEFAVPTLRALAKVVQVQAVYTQPDRPAGRHLQLRPPPVKIEALELGLPIFQPERCRDPRVVAQIEGLHPDALVVAAYGQIVPQIILDLPRLGPINLHASLLPKYRGAAPIHWAIIMGEKQTGVTTFFMNSGLDTGPLLLQRAIRIEPDDHVLTLEGKLSQVGALLMLETLDLLAEERLRAVPQDELLVTHAPKLKKPDGEIDWNKAAADLSCFVRGTYPFPGAHTFCQGIRLKVHQVAVSDPTVRDAAPGEIVGLTHDRVFVQSGQGVLELIEVQPDSKPRMPASDFANGHRLAKGMVFERQPNSQNSA